MQPIVPHVHIIGAGASGLACAVALATSGIRSTLYEAAPQAGGRCRSRFDPQWGVELDIGSHLLLSGNRTVGRFLQRIGARERWQVVVPAELPFYEPGSGQWWRIAPGRGPFWLLDPVRRVPESGWRDYTHPLLALLSAAATETVATALAGVGITPHMWARLWTPLTLAALNAAPHEASAQMLGVVLRQTLLRGEAACRPTLARTGLSVDLIDPAVTWLAWRGSHLEVRQRLRRLTLQGRQVATLHFADGRAVPVLPGEKVVLALPPPVLAAVLADTVPAFTYPVPESYQTIINLHFLLPQSVTLPQGKTLLGLVGCLAEWVFVRGPVLSVTISAARRLDMLPAEQLAVRVWDEVAPLVCMGRKGDGVAAALRPLWRVYRDRRATWTPTPATLLRRPSARTSLANLFCAGDWVNTGLPATLEGAMCAGEQAAVWVCDSASPLSANLLW